MTYTPRYHYTPDEQLQAIYSDLLVDAKHAEQQAVEGPFFPERGITSDSLKAYAQDCRNKLARLQASDAPALTTVNRFIAGKDPAV